jgi:hypothetical protein
MKASSVAATIDGAQWERIKNDKWQMTNDQWQLGWVSQVKRQAKRET